MDMKALVQIQKPVFWETLGKIFEMASMLRKLEMAYLPAGLEEVKCKSLVTFCYCNKIPEAGQLYNRKWFI